MKNTKYSVTILIVLFIMATVFEWGMVWKLIVGGYSVYILVRIALKILESRK